MRDDVGDLCADESNFNANVEGYLSSYNNGIKVMAHLLISRI